MNQRSLRSLFRGSRRPVVPQAYLRVESLEDRVVLDVGDTIASAFPTELGPRSGTFQQASEVLGDGDFGTMDVDIYRIDVRAYATLNARTSLPPGGDSMDTVLRVFNEAGQEVAFNDDCGSLYSCIDVQLTQAGTYYVGVSGYRNFTYNPNQGGSGISGSTGDYRLDLNLRSTVGPTVSSFSQVYSTGPISSVNVRFDRPMDPSTFTPADVTWFYNPIAAVAVQSVTPVSGSGNREFQLAFAQQSLAGYYVMQFGPDIADPQGNVMDQDEDDLPGQFGDQYVAIFAIAGPSIWGTDPARAGRNPLTEMRVYFSRAMSPESFTAEDVYLNGPTGSVAISDVVPADATNREFIVQLAEAQTTLGDYDVIIGTSIFDTYGNPLDNDYDLIGGEPEDQLQFSFRLLPEGCYEYEAFGYQACVAAFENIDLVPGGPGVFTIIENGDDRSASVNLGANTFNFYGTSYTGPGQLHVSSNGLVTFGTPFTAFTNTDLSETPLERAIAPLWDDWVKNSPLTGMVLGRFDGDRLIIEWNEVQHFPTDPLLGTVTFQLILQLNTGSTPSAMWFNYVDLDMGEPAYDKAASATVGIKDLNAQGSRRLVAQFNSTEGWAATGNAIRVAVPPQSGPGRGAGDNGAAVLASLGAVEQRIETTVPATLSRSALEQTFAAERTPASPQAVAQLFATMAEKEVSRGAGSSTLFELDLKAL